MSKRRKRYSPTTIFIACEGTKTEPIYFERIKEELEEEGQFILTIYPDKTEKRPKTDAMGLVREARRRSEDFDEVWAVFDKNGYTLHEQVFKEAAKIIAGKKVHIAFSSISFEHWILLHFERNLKPFTKSASVIDYLRSNNYYPNYSKKDIIDSYTFLKDKTQTALENSAWLKTAMSSDLATAKNKIFDVNPYCTVNSLVGKLLYNNTSIVCILLNESLELKDIVIRFFKKKNDYCVSLINHSSTTILFNNSNLSNYFKVRSNKGAFISLSLDKIIIIKPKEEETFPLFSTSQCQNGQFNFYLNQGNINIRIISFF